MRAALLVLALSGLGSVAASGQAAPAPVAPPATDLEVRFVANEGFLIDGAGRRVLVDGLVGPNVTGFPIGSPEMRDELERGVGIWSGIDVALATHSHPDHFNADSVARFLRSSPEALFVSTPQSVALLEAAYPGATFLSRARAVLPEPGASERLELRGIAIEVLNLHHGARQPPVDNLGFLITLGSRRVLHLGDTEAKMPDFEPYLDRLADVDLGLLPFWFLSSAWRAEMVRERIRPRWIVVAHLPLPTAPAGYFARWHSYENLVSLIGDAFPEARFPESPGETYRFAD